MSTGDESRRQAKDDALVRCTQAGDRQAFGELVEVYGPRVIAICARVAGLPYNDAQDLAQEAFLRAYTHLGQYEPGRSFFAWLYRIAVNLALNARNRRPPPTLGGETGALLLNSVGDPDPAGQPAAQAEQAERAAVIAHAVAGLPEDYATVVALRYGADLDYQAIADTLDIPLGTVKARLHRAKALLRARLADLAEEEGT